VPIERSQKRFSKEDSTKYKKILSETASRTQLPAWGRGGDKERTGKIKWK
jgi:hypothetical protein